MVLQLKHSETVRAESSGAPTIFNCLLHLARCKRHRAVVQCVLATKLADESSGVGSCLCGEGLVNCLTNFVAMSRLFDRLLPLKDIGWFGGL